VLLQVDRQTPTLLNSCKLVFKLSREEKNDQSLADEEIPKLLIDVLESASLEQDTPALVYCCGALKNMSMNEGIQSKPFPPCLS